jgi:hypothetical protein
LVAAVHAVKVADGDCSGASGLVALQFFAG